MDCERTRQLLPWLLNGSLEEPELTAVRDHLSGCAACRAELAETRLAGEVFGAHLSTDDLVAWAIDQPTSVDRELVAAHLVHCERCADELALVAESRRQTDGETAAAPGATVVPFESREARAAAREATLRRRAGGWLSAIAAGLVAVVGLGGWTITAQRAGQLEDRLEAERAEAAATAGQVDAAQHRVAALRAQVGEQSVQIAALERAAASAPGRAAPAPAAPRPGLLVNRPLRLFRPETMRGGAPAAGKAATLSIDAGADQVNLEIELPRPAAGDPYEVRILGPDGGVVVRGAAKPDDQGYLNLALPVDAVPRPRFTVEVRGAGGGEPVARYEVQVKG
jgi:predicted anti-sigma-YlaC factor YlaD